MNFFVDIAHLSDNELEFFGWYLQKENAEFKIYARSYGEDAQIVLKAKPMLKVDDFNDATYMKATKIVQVP